MKLLDSIISRISYKNCSRGARASLTDWDLILFTSFSRRKNDEKKIFSIGEGEEGGGGGGGGGCIWDQSKRKNRGYYFALWNLAIPTNYRYYWKKEVSVTLNARVGVNWFGQLSFVLLLFSLAFSTRPGLLIFLSRNTIELLYNANTSIDFKRNPNCWVYFQLIFSFH